MDTSKEYTCQCDCEEVQGQWEPKPGDFIHYTTSPPACYKDEIKDINDVEQICMCSEFGKEVEKREWGDKIAWIEYEGHDHIVKYEKPIWLPTQDQIQGMLDIKGLDSMWIFFLRFYVNQDWIISEYALKFKTHEQLLLAFYMWRKGKTWDGEKWVKNK